MLIHTFPVQQREGLIRTPNFVVQPSLPHGEIQFILNIPTADYEDPLNSIQTDLQMEDPSVPGGWRSRAPHQWIGGRFVDPEDGTVNPAPIVCSLTVTDFERGKTFRVEFNVPRRMRAGAVVDLLEM